jgi:MATE family multidrug resistance protein
VCSDIHLVSEVVTLVASILPLVAMYQVFDGIAAVTSGILRARGKQVSTRLFYCTL